MDFYISNGLIHGIGSPWGLCTSGASIHPVQPS